MLNLQLTTCMYTLYYATMRRSLIITTVVGGTIIAVNQGDGRLAGAVIPRVFVKMLLTPCVPFCVSFYGAYGCSGELLPCVRSNLAGL